MDSNLLRNIISVTELRRNFGEITSRLPHVESLILTRGGEPFAILKAAPTEKNKVLRKTAGVWKHTALDEDALWKRVLHRTSRKRPIRL
ncbi:MAG: hypothetical protein Q8R11_01545 [bacterium]|nr:hypothetical protein [bacterium]